MKKYFLCRICLLFATLVIALLHFNDANAALGNYTIICGQTTGGQPINCNMETHRCYSCKKAKGLLVRTITYEYQCLSRSAPVPRKCEISNTGGMVGNSDVRIVGLKMAGLHREGSNCVTENFKAMYTSTCYSCEIVEILSSAFIKAAAKAYQVSREAGNAILVVGMILWVAFFVLKNISAFTTVEPMKMLQDLLIQLFKLLLAFVIVNAGIPTILHYTLEPIMNAGTDFASAIIAANTEVNTELTAANQAELEQEAQDNAVTQGGAK